ncbi:hypothetical protein, partial [Thermococcus sp.]|uniref:hypothetical protein n=1 Tax=Thermococcus sp. TaxID=35749 RepID=UPI0026302DB0
NFALWLSVMAFYYLLNGLVTLRGPVSLGYWMVAIVLAVPLTIKIWNRLKGLYSTFYHNSRRNGRKIAVLVTLPWVVGSAVGWWLIPSITSIGVSADARLGVGFLSFIGISLLGQWLVMTQDRCEFEMMPSFILPLLAIPIAWNMNSGTITWVSFVVATGFSLTILWYLYSAFRAIER